MGVLGLTPFLQKTCPEVIKQLPDRLHTLTGKTIVLDGTLITQRFHFAHTSHPYRHVLGWYRLANELSQAGVSAICVFDGKERNAAKAREAERRKELQRQTVARGMLENGRSKRLHKLSNILPQFFNLNSATRERTVGLLRQLRSETEPNSRNTALGVRALQPVPQRAINTIDTTPHDGDAFPSHIAVEEALDPTSENTSFHVTNDVQSPCHRQTGAQVSPFQNTAPFIIPEILNLSDNPDILQDLVNLPGGPYISEYKGKNLCLSESKPSDRASPYTHVSSAQTDEVQLTTTELSPPSQSPFSTETFHTLLGSSTKTLHIENAISATLASLYLDYQQSISKLASLTRPPSPHFSPSPSVTDPEMYEEVAMTKAQHQLTQEEGEFWENLVSASSKVPALALAQLSYTSNAMADSFQRRMNPPTSRTYDECKEILRAMGLPCLDSTGATEAEALASSIVLNGLADYVASEDTDVLIYEAPLIRNLTNRHIPLTIISGVDIRTVLRLDRSSFIDFALLLGTDFSQRIKNIGPSRALKFIREHGCIERIIELETKYLPRISPKAYLTQVETARAIFNTLPPVPEKNLLEPRIIDEAEVIEILQHYGLGGAVINPFDSEDWDYSAALDGNYFQDDPRA